MKKKPQKSKEAKRANVEVLDDQTSEPQPLDKALATVSDNRAIVTTDPLVMYLAEIRKYPLLTADEEKRLAIQYRETGDAEAAHKLITSNLRFVVKVAAEYSKFGAKMIDLVQEGNVGLMHAVKEFNPYKGVRLITYAVWWIRGYIREYLMRQYSVVRMGTTHAQKKLFYNLQGEAQKSEQTGELLDVSEVSQKLGVSEEDVESMRGRLSGRDVSLDQALSEDSKSTLLDLQATPEEMGLDDQLAHEEELASLRNKIDKIRPHLNDKEILILESRLLADEPKTLQEIGDQVGITRERARQLEARLLSKIKKAYEESGEPAERSDI